MNPNQVKIKYATVGPREDPYERITYTAEVDEQHVVLTCCALAGNELEVNGVVVSSRRHGEPDGDRPIEEFEAVVKLTVDEIAAAHDDAYDPDVAEAERAAGWDPSP